MALSTTERRTFASRLGPSSATIELECLFVKLSYSDVKSFIVRRLLVTEFVAPAQLSPIHTEGQPRRTSLGGLL